MDIDTYIRQRIQASVANYQQCEPSLSFCDRVMTRAVKLERKRMWTHRITVTLFVFMPLIVRQIWDMTRGDYFSIGHWPFGHPILSAYNFFMLPGMLYVLGIAGVAGVIILVAIPTLKSQRSY